VHDTSTAGTPTPTDPDLDERVRDILSHIFGEAHADGESDKLIASVTKQAASQHHEWSKPKAQDIPAADLRKMLSQCQRPDKPSVIINGVEYVAKLNDVMYQVSNHKKTTLPLALIDRGTNGGVAGSDTRLIDKSLRSVHIQGIDDHMIKDVPIGTVSAVVNTQRGEVIAIMHQYAYTGKGSRLLFIPPVSSNGVATTSTIVPLRLMVVDNDSLHQTVTSFPSTSGVVCHISRCAPLKTKNSKSSRTFFAWTSEDDWDPTSVLSPMTLIGTKLNLHLLYPIQCMMSMGSSVDVFLLTNASGRFITSMHLTRSQVFITTNFTMPWSNLRMTQIASLTSSSTVLIVHVTFATMRQWRLLLGHNDFGA
jgi:hypothetical protein